MKIKLAAATHAAVHVAAGTRAATGTAGITAARSGSGSFAAAGAAAPFGVFLAAALSLSGLFTQCAASLSTGAALSAAAAALIGAGRTGSIRGALAWAVDFAIITVPHAVCIGSDKGYGGEQRCRCKNS